MALVFILPLRCTLMFLISVHSFYIFFFNLVSVNWTEFSVMPASCISQPCIYVLLLLFLCFLTSLLKGLTSKIWVYLLMHVLFSCVDWFCSFDLRKNLLMRRGLLMCEKEFTHEKRASHVWERIYSWEEGFPCVRASHVWRSLLMCEGFLKQSWITWGDPVWLTRC